MDRYTFARSKRERGERERASGELRRRIVVPCRGSTWLDSSAPRVTKTAHVRAELQLSAAHPISSARDLLPWRCSLYVHTHARARTGTCKHKSSIFRSHFLPPVPPPPTPKARGLISAPRPLLQRGCEPRAYWRTRRLQDD